MLPLGSIYGLLCRSGGRSLKVERLRHRRRRRPCGLEGTAGACGDRSAIGRNQPPSGGIAAAFFCELRVPARELAGCFSTRRVVVPRDRGGSYGFVPSQLWRLSIA